MRHYDEKFRYLVRRQGGLCPIAKERYGRAESPTELHHKLHNTKTNRKLYPLYIDSVWNLAAVAHWSHMALGSWGKISYLEAGKREAFLRRHPLLASWMNGELDYGTAD